MALYTVQRKLLLITVLILIPLKIKADTLNQFQKQNLCFLQDRIQYGYSRSTANIDGQPMTCARLCMMEVDCIGFSFKNKSTTRGVILINGSEIEFEEEKNCYLHEEFLTNDKCVGHAIEVDHMFYRKIGVCANGGVWNEEKGECICDATDSKPDIMVGPMCTAVPRNCRDLSNGGIRSFGDFVYFKPWPYFNEEKKLLYCAVLENGETRMRMATNTKTKAMFNKTWHDFDSEFGDKNHYWIGLKMLRRIIFTTAESTTIHIEVNGDNGEGSSSNLGTSKFYDIEIGDESDGYRLTYSTFTLFGVFLENSERFCWQYSNNTKFSTFDKDNDDNGTENCAAVNGIGWWFGSDCTSPCNLFGSKYINRRQLRRIDPPYSPGQIRVPGLSRMDLAVYFENVHMEIHA